MAQRSFPFDSVAGDRELDTAQWARHTQAMTSNGVVAGHADELEVTPTAPESLAVDVQLGRFWVEGRYYEVFSEPVTVTLQTADATDPRIDRIVVRRSLANREVTVEALTGTPAPSPSPPAVTQNASGDWEESLAEVLVAANATKIFAADITDERFFSDVPVVQIFEVSDTWTKPAGLRYAVVECIGPGGGGGGAEGTGAGQAAAGMGGSSGGYSRSLIVAGSLGATETVTVSTGGAGGVGGTVGDNGSGVTSFGAHVSANPGNGGGRIVAGSGLVVNSGTIRATVGTGDLTIAGNAGGGAIRLSATQVLSGFGGAGPFGGSASERSAADDQRGENGGLYGSGGSGAVTIENQSGGRDGGAGRDGLVIVTEYF